MLDQISKAQETVFLLTSLNGTSIKLEVISHFSCLYPHIWIQTQTHSPHVLKGKMFLEPTHPPSPSMGPLYLPGKHCCPLESKDSDNLEGRRGWAGSGRDQGEVKQ